jgi:DNA-binding NarL/FixJ family response regulator
MPSRFSNGTLKAVLACADDDLRRRVEDALVGERITVSAHVAATDRAAAALESSGADAIVVVSEQRTHTDRDSQLARLRTSAGDAAIVLVAPADTRRGVRSAVEAGVDGLVFQDDVEERLAPTVRAACAGQVVVPRSNRHELGRPSLSSREKQALRLIVMGFSNKEIAAKLYLAESTVKCHLSSAFAKLGVHSRNEAVDLILDQGEELGLGILKMTRRTESPLESWAPQRAQRAR